MRNYLIAYTMAIFIAVSSIGCATTAPTCAVQYDTWAAEKRGHLRDTQSLFAGGEDEIGSQNWLKYSEGVVIWAKPHYLKKCEDAKK